ncbi:MAG: glutamine-hydrolyzing GMP synthase [Rhodospirillaceae bacterium]|nr:glutamine-hydrolyzing GMP synthase [Rhodospirillaceae bacterium]|tara:strand:- start:712 stop:2508 length:1797 start_codon:yes stop_codon:yes gene_type:complete
MRPGVAVLDFGGQYAHLIANRIRRLQVYSEIFAPTADPSEIEGAAGIVYSGGPGSVYDSDQPAFNDDLLSLNLPILGLCYGHQLICQRLGGEVVPGEVREYGTADLRILANEGPFAGLGTEETVWMSHGDTVSRLPDGFELIGETPDCPAAAVGDPERRIYGFQFHPEVAHTPNGNQMLDNFLTLCEVPREWTMSGYAEEAMKQIRQQTDGRNVFLLVSGGVDSTVAFMLINKALGPERVQGLHIDNGFMRKQETELVGEYMKANGFDNLIIEDASDEFLLSVEGMSEPEAKRHAIGKTFLDVKDRLLDELELDPEAWLLGQGTLYPDTIESGGTENAALIKTHHNRIDAIEEMIAQGKVVEPLAQLYKDEVRDLGETLGIPHALVWRHPFPGPGLGVRCLCSTGDIEPVSHESEQSAREIAESAGLSFRVLPIQSVGVQGDFRTYAHPGLVWGEPDWLTLEDVSTRITNSVQDVNRVIYLISPEEPPVLELKRAFLDRRRLDLLREADAIAMQAIVDDGFEQEIAQMPTVLLPLSSDGAGETVVLRPIVTPDFMTARFCELPMDFVKTVADRIAALDGIDAVCYDVTHKPPATVEWE